MRTYKATSVFAVVLTLLFAANAFAALPNVQYFSFAGWDSSLIDNGPGQTFNVGNGINVTVQGFGDFTVPSEATTATSFRSGHLVSGDRNQFHFTFDTSLPVVIKTATVDLDEQVEIIGVGPETYVNMSGGAPTVTPITSGIEIQGTGYGTGTGAAMGETMTYAQINQAVIVRHDSLRNNKWEFFMVGTTIPEPNSVGLLGLGAFGLILGGRKRRNR